MPHTSTRLCKFKRKYGRGRAASDEQRFLFHPVPPVFRFVASQGGVRGQTEREGQEKGVERRIDLSNEKFPCVGLATDGEVFRAAEVHMCGSVVKLNEGHMKLWRAGIRCLSVYGVGAGVGRLGGRQSSAFPPSQGR